MHVMHVVGARPNFVKVAPVMAALGRRSGTTQTLVHTGQHYDVEMSEVFFRQLGIPKPDINLGVGSGSHAEQTARIMDRFELVLLDRRPDLVLVYGDVNSTLAAALVCTKSLVPLGHVESGLRSFDRSMPEEINRVLTDQVADLLFTPSADADENLLREGRPRENIHRVGNVMIDTLVRCLEGANSSRILGQLRLCQGTDWQGLDSKVPRQSATTSPYGLVTLHRPPNVDDHVTFSKIIKTLIDISRDLPVVFPVHPRTRKQITTLGLGDSASQLRLLDPLGYVEFLALERVATFVITDSGGVQEETTYLGIPCLTVRQNTERPVTVTLGTNTVVGNDMDRLRAEVHRILSGLPKRGQVPPLWDGKASERIADILTGRSTHNLVLTGV